MSNTSQHISVIAVDFDGTMVEHQYPDIGKEIPGAVQVLQALANEGHRIILYTMRDNINKVPEWPEPYNCKEAPTVIEVAKNWCKEHYIPIFAVNDNPRCTFSKSRKVYADIYIDDAALGCPLVSHIDNRGFTYGKSMVDWYMVEGMLVERGLLPKRRIPKNFYVENKLFPLT